MIWLGGLSQRRWLWLVLLMGTLVSTAFAVVTPLWQAPDEPGHVEYACLLGQMHRPLNGDDLDPAVQREIIASLDRQRFWTQVRTPRPDPLPGTFAADPFLLRSGRQVGDEPPTYYLIPAILCRLDASIETRLRLMRVFGALLWGATAMAVAWGWSGGAAGRLRVLHPAVLLLLPMPAFIAGSANNDGMAAAAAALSFAAVLRIQRLGWRWRWAAVALAAAILAVATKKTAAFLLVWLAGLAVAQAWITLRRRGQSRRRVLGSAALAGLILAALAALPSPAPAGWRSAGLPFSVTRVAVDGSSAARVTDRSPLGVARIYQSLTGPELQTLRGRAVRLSAQVRSADGTPAEGRLTVRDAAAVSQTRFVAGDRWQTVAVTHTVAADTAHVKIAVAPGAGDTPSELGSLLVRQVTLEADQRPAPLANPGFDQPARMGTVVLAPLADTWDQFRPRLAAASQDWARYPLYAALLFPGFWGNFGWLQAPLPVWTYAGLAIACLAGLLGAWQVLRDRAEPLRGVTANWLAAVLLAILLALLPMIGRQWQPQGRYLFGAGPDHRPAADRPRPPAGFGPAPEASQRCCWVLPCSSSPACCGPLESGCSNLSLAGLAYCGRSPTGPQPPRCYVLWPVSLAVAGLRPSRRRRSCLFRSLGRSPTEPPPRVASLATLTRHREP
ncbi:MAG: DUF2142 domain-containing protein [Caldilineales bacterium]